MKNQTYVATLLFTLLFPFVVSAETRVAIPGKVGSVTISLVERYTDGGFKNSDGEPTSSKVIFDTPARSKTLYRDVLKSRKYSNKQFIADVLLHYASSDFDKVSEWAVKYVDGYGFFMVHKAGTVVYVGGKGDVGFPLNVMENGSSFLYPNNTSETIDKVAGEAVTVTTSGTESPMELNQLKIQFGDWVINARGITSETSIYNSVYDVATQAEDLTYTVRARSINNIIGEDGYSIYTGSIKFSPLKNVPDVSNYIAAYNEWFEGSE